MKNKMEKKAKARVYDPRHHKRDLKNEVNNLYPGNNIPYYYDFVNKL